MAFYGAEVNRDWSKSKGELKSPQPPFAKGGQEEASLLKVGFLAALFIKGRALGFPLY